MEPVAHFGTKRGSLAADFGEDYKQYVEMSAADFMFVPPDHRILARLNAWPACSRSRSCAW
jgi:hypothetical protein